MALARSQIEQHTHKRSAASENQQQQQQQDRQPPVERRPGQGRAGQGWVQWLVVVVVVAASETVRLSWLVVLTVDSLSTVDLTSQGFFYIPSCACVHLCVGACMCAPKRKKKVCVFMCAFHVRVT